MRSLLTITKTEGDIIVASGSKSKLSRDMSLKRETQNWNIKYVDIARSPRSARRVFTSSERLANHLKIKEIGEVGKLVTKTETHAPKLGKSLKKNEMYDPKVGEIREVGKKVRKIEMGVIRELEK